MDKVRRQENKELRKQGDDRLVGTKYDWLRNRENFQDDAWQTFQALRHSNLKTARAWAIKEQALRLWDYYYPKSAETFFGRWYGWAIRSRLAPVKKVARMFKRHLANILTFFTHRLTNGPIEGLNNKIQGLIKKAFGYRNKERFKTDVLFHLGGLDLYPAQ